MAGRLISFRDKKRLEEETGFARSTFYKWRCVKKYPALFTKIGGTVFVDLAELEKLIESGRGKAR